jgi:hypothetical protein
VLLSLAGMLIGRGILTPRNEAVFLKKSRDLVAANDYPRCLLEFRNASMAAWVNPHHAGAQLKIAEIMTSGKRPETLTKAAGQLRELLEVLPKNVEAADALAMTERRLGNRAGAMERLQELLADFGRSCPPRCCWHE